MPASSFHGPYEMASVLGRESDVDWVNGPSITGSHVCRDVIGLADEPKEAHEQGH